MKHLDKTIGVGSLGLAGLILTVFGFSSHQVSSSRGDTVEASVHSIAGPSRVGTGAVVCANLLENGDADIVALAMEQGAVPAECMFVGCAGLY